MEVTATQNWPSLWMYDAMQQKPHATDKDLKKQGWQLLGMKVKGRRQFWLENACTSDILPFLLSFQQ